MTKKLDDATNEKPPMLNAVQERDDRPLWIAIRSALLGIVSAIETYKLGMVCKHVKITGKDE